MIKQESIEKLKSIIDIVDVVSSYIQLKKAGSNYKALCPFHAEKTPSFVVSREKQIYHCFGCNATGDAIKFVMDIENLSYKEAIEKLASLYNIELEYTKSFKFDSTPLLKKVAEYYISNLYKNKKAIDYLYQRGITENSIEKFKIGFAPSKIEQINYFKQHNFNIEELIKTGVIVKDKSIYPRLIERITFPIFSETGKIIAFGGRTISNHPAKYINFTNTIYFNKSRTFYGLNFAKEHIRKQKKIFITEGYIDVIMMHQANFSNTIATLGTSLTEYHLPTLRKLNSKVYIIYDGDNAGIEAALRASKLLYKNEFEGGVIILPSSKDPADIIKEKEDLNNYLKPIDFIEFIIQKILSKYEIKKASQKKLAINELKEYISSLPIIFKEEFAEKVAQYLNITKESLLIKEKQNFNTTQNNQLKKIDIATASIIKTLYNNRDLIDEVIEYLDENSLKHHKEELSLLYKGDFNNPKLLDIVLLEEIKTLSYEELKNQIRKILVSYYEEELKKSKYKKDILLIRKYIDILNKLRKGAPIESISTI